MLGASPTLTAAVTAHSQTVVTDAQVDLTRNGSYSDVSDAISAWSFSRTLTTDLPDGARLVSGYAAAELDLTGIGNKNNNVQNGAWYWSTYNRAGTGALTGASGRIGTPVRVHAGMKTTAGNEVLPRFTGTLRSIEVDGQQATAALTVLDGSDRMRAQCNIPMIIGDYLQTDYLNGAVRQGLNGGTILDYLFRANGFYSTPKPRTGCVLSVPGHGSLEPDYVVDQITGQYTQYGSTIFANDGGSRMVQYVADTHNDSRTGKPKIKFGQCPDPQKGINAQWALASNITMSTSTTFTLETWVDLSNPMGAASGSKLISFEIDVVPSSGPNVVLTVGFMGDSRPFLQYNTMSPVFGTGVSAGSRGWLYALINISFTSTNVNAAFTLNSTAPTVGNGRVITQAGTFGGTAESLTLLGDTGSNAHGATARFEGLQLTTEASGAAIAATNVAFAPGAVIEPSLNSLTAVPFSPDLQDSWQTAQEVAAAEFGVLFFDESGAGTFWNRNHVTAQPSAVATVTTSGQLTALTTSESVDSVKNHIVATITPYQVQAAGYVYSLGKTIGLHSKQTFTYTAQFDNPAVGIQTTMVYIPFGDPSGPESGYRACRTPDGTGNPVSNLSFTITPYAQSAIISIFNPNNFPVYLVCPVSDDSGNVYPTSSAGQPFLRLYGFPVIQSLSPTTTASGADVATTATLEVKDTSSMTLYGPQEYDISASNWLQDSDSVQGIITDMLGQLCRPFPILTNVTIVADPRLQLGDRIRVQDSVGTQLDNDFYVVGIDEALDPTSGYTQTLTLRSIGGPMAWTLEDPVKGKLDSVYVLGGLF